MRGKHSRVNMTQVLMYSENKNVLCFCTKRRHRLNNEARELKSEEPQAHSLF